jgi:hypothetical protein
LSARAHTDAELEAAVAAISDPDALSEAQDIVARTAPSLQRLLAGALHEGGWFSAAHDQALHEAVGTEDAAERERLLQTLIAEETRLGMLVGVAVGFQLARELDRSGRDAGASETRDNQGD